jgi:DNA-binding NarL/FixJ family response regulator
MRVLIVDDHTLVRMGMCLLLETMRGIIVVGEAADGAQAMRLIDERRPDCVLMDLAMPGMNGLDAARLITERFPAVRVLVVSMHAEEAYVQQALAAGAAGYLLKGADKAGRNAGAGLSESGHLSRRGGRDGARRRFERRGNSAGRAHPTAA